MPLSTLGFLFSILFFILSTVVYFVYFSFLLLSFLIGRKVYFYKYRFTFSTAIWTVSIFSEIEQHDHQKRRSCIVSRTVLLFAIKTLSVFCYSHFSYSCTPSKLLSVYFKREIYAGNFHFFTYTPNFRFRYLSCSL